MQVEYSRLHLFIKSLVTTPAASMLLLYCLLHIIWIKINFD